MAILTLAAKACLLFAVAVLLLYAARHYVLAFSRLFQKRSRDMMELTGFVLPRISVLVPMHNEEKVAADILRALVESDYDRDRLEVFAINDRSEDRTGEIIDEYAAKYPMIRAVHRTEGKGGKGEALKEVTQSASGEILLLFDADYFPGRSMLKFLVTPFCDPQVGAVMGRVVPHNAEASLLAALLSLERAAGYQIGQQVRHNLGLTPQFGGTVGGVRASALKAVGGWDPASLTEDTDLTFRLVVNGWKVTYVNRAECYEEVPQTWEVRKKQITRWATGHTECLHRLWPALLRSRFLSALEKVDALFVLACYLTAPVLVLGWLASLALFFAHDAGAATALSVALAFVGYQIFGNQATFFELGSAALLDGTYQRVLLIPVNLFNFFASTTAITAALLRFYWSRIWGGRGPRWQKTKRYRGKDAREKFNGGNGSAMKLFTQGANGIYVRHFDSRQT
jgi:cellulose synthase/poly-beta-1,6-N-acetylglucosamine synthase-like glycosyltransferase